MSFVSVHHRQLSFMDLGKGTPIIFIHPPGFGKIIFRYQQPLSNRYRLISYDMCGHGFSETSPEQVTIDFFAKELKGLMDVLSIEKAVICGYSAGGSIAQHFALTYPKRTLGLILSGPYPHVVTPLLKTEFHTVMALVKRARPMLEQIFTIAHSIRKEDQPPLNDVLKRADQRIWYDYYKASYTYTCWNQLPLIYVPVLVAYGKYDHIRVYKGVYQDRLQIRSVAIVEKAFHELPTRQSNAFNHLVDTFIRTKIG